MFGMSRNILSGHNLCWTGGSELFSSTFFGFRGDTEVSPALVAPPSETLRRYRLELALLPVCISASSKYLSPLLSCDLADLRRIGNLG